MGKSFLILVIGLCYLLLPSIAELSPLVEITDPNNFLGVTQDDWLLLLKKMGFSFIIGLSIGYALKIFTKILLVSLGMLLLALFGLQYVDFIIIDWHSLEPRYESFITWLVPQLSSFRDFITSHLPSSSMSALGLFIGFKKKW